jgi:hypothetical protein
MRVVGDYKRTSPWVGLQEIDQVLPIYIECGLIVELDPQPMGFEEWVPDILLCCHRPQSDVLPRFWVFSIGRLPVQDCS